jgi:hypothetical protein
VTGSCEFGNEPSSSIKCGKFLDQLRTCYILKKDFAAWSNIIAMILGAVLDSSGRTRAMNHRDHKYWRIS